ncbi:hypothetical protein CYMTET_24722 [Cymbomonas tetramitiformis]|uniref:Uncharacterized protein n=1 Tax=Cymbomonas tetramitiformis TaxID=36881 RepID=A0AAE0FW28_9CHLO|nr:hypothetical protein CYMTET_24722 [Cymbomonas tetramitiformis]
MENMLTLSGGLAKINLYIPVLVGIAGVLFDFSYKSSVLGSIMEGLERPTGPLASDKIPFAAILAIFAIYVLCHFGYVFTQLCDDGWDNSTPRVVKKYKTGIAARFVGAHENTFEAWCFFSVTIIIAKSEALLPTQDLAKLSVLFVLLRIMYTVAYISNVDIIRTITWFASTAIPVLLLFIAAAPPEYYSSTLVYLTDIGV